MTRGTKYRRRATLESESSQPKEQAVESQDHLRPPPHFTFGGWTASLANGLQMAHFALKKAKRKGERHGRQYGSIPACLLEEVASARTHLQSVIRARKREAWREFLIDNSITTRDLWST